MKALAMNGGSPSFADSSVFWRSFWPLPDSMESWRTQHRAVRMRSACEWLSGLRRDGAPRNGVSRSGGDRHRITSCVIGHPVDCRHAGRFERERSSHASGSHPRNADCRNARRSRSSGVRLPYRSHRSASSGVRSIWRRRFLRRGMRLLQRSRLQLPFGMSGNWPRTTD